VFLQQFKRSFWAKSFDFDLCFQGLDIQRKEILRNLFLVYILDIYISYIFPRIFFVFLSSKLLGFSHT